MSIVVLAAAPFETEPLQRLLAQSRIGSEVTIRHIGIGVIASASAATSYKSEIASSSVYFLGSCGTFTSALEPGPPRVVTAARVHWLPAGDRAGISYTIADTAPPRALVPAANIECATVISGPSISLSKELPPGLASGQIVENVELYGVAQVLAPIQPRPILAITNEIGPSAHEQWRENYQRAAIVACEKLLQVIEGGEG